MLAGRGAVHFPRAEPAVSSDDGGLLAGCDVSSPLRDGGLGSASRRPADLPEIQPVRLGGAFPQPGGRRFPTGSRGHRHLEHLRSHALQLLVSFTTFLSLSNPSFHAKPTVKPQLS